MAKAVVRLQALEVAILAGLAAVLARSAQVQLVQGRRYAEEARAQRTERVTLDAQRGGLYDRNGTAIALTQETYHVGVAPNELRDPGRDAVTLARALRRGLATVRESLRKRYAYFPGPYSALEVRPIRDLRGVHLEPVLNRFYPAPEFARAVIGRVGADGHGTSGLERELDSLLAGRAGAAVVLKDRAGREYESPSRLIAAPVPGADVVLTLDAELQEIAQGALGAALQKTNAEGGDVVILDPQTGELLAVASRRRDGNWIPSAFTATYEPGSIAKIFAAAALLAHARVRPTDRVSGKGGNFRLAGRTLQDDEVLPTLTLADAIRVSSNIAIAQFVQRLSPAEQFSMLRDFGLGTPTGIEFPSESPGRLRPPTGWSKTSAVSLAIGYELAVTPLQIAAAYAAIANDGVLLSPTLIREIRDPAGELLYRHRPEPVRRVVSPAIARQLRALLRSVVEKGTGSGATLAHFELAAKTGTARRTVNGRYAQGQYVASFAALFPADDPQLVVVVKLDNPGAGKGAYYAAQTAAPVTRFMLEQALASRTVTLDRARRSVATVAAAEPPALEADPGVAPYVVPWPFHPDTAAGRTARQVVPDVTGRPLREAVRALHRRGFRVVLRGWGLAEHTWPAAGASADAGSAVTLFGTRP
jgi:cell division protein FtsI (penicillin-binding protein 3)